MVFKKENIASFEQLFAENESKIKRFKGCLFVELYQDKTDPCVFFTYSHWEDEDALEDYRRSRLFKRVWATTKVLFGEKPKAWSLIQKSS